MTDLAVNDAGDILALGADGQWAPARIAENDRGERLAFDGQRWRDARGLVDDSRARQENSGPLGFLRGVTRAGQNGLLFGLRDEATAAAQAGTNWIADRITGRSPQTLSGPITGEGGGSGYDAALRRERALDRTFAQDHPAANIAANVAGGIVAPGLPIAPALQGTGLAARLLRSLPTRVAAQGAAGGAAAGFGEGEGGLGARLESAGQGAAIGAVAAPAIAVGANVARRVGGRVLDVAGLRNPDVAADRQILRALERDGVDVATMPPAPQGAPLTIADQGGRNTVNLAAVAANTPGASMEAADSLVQARRAARPERIAGAVDGALGGGGGTRVADEVDVLRTRRAAEAAPRYEESFRRIVPTDDEIARVLPGVEDPIGQNALQRGLRVIELENVAERLRDPSVAPFDPAQYGVRRGDDGSFVVEDGYRNLRLLDAVKRGYDEIVEGFRDKTTGRLNLDQYGRAVNSARAGFVANLRDMYPRYGSALDAWSGPTQSMEALGRGRRALTMDRDQVSQMVGRLSPSDREFFRLGLGRAVTDAASDPARAASLARRLVEDRQMQARLDAAIPDQVQRSAFQDALRREVEMAAVERAVSPRAGSQTARLTAAGEDMATDPPGGMMLSLLAAGERGGIGGAAARGLSVLYRRAQGINSSTADALAQRLFSTDAAGNAATIQRLEGLRGRDLAVEAMQRELSARLMRSAGAAAGLNAN